jgi:hypothetical protein
MGVRLGQLFTPLIPYTGGLMVTSCPLGATYTITTTP